jgi:DNA-binding NarL/FixJ family response regulator
MVLTPRQLDVVLAMGQGLRVREIATRFHITRSTAATYIRDLERDTGMSWISLAVMGYCLAGQMEQAA